jgi:hypothetical protein
LRRLSKREVDAIVSHEIAHTRPKSRIMISVTYMIVVAMTLTVQFVPETITLLPLLVVALVLAFKAWRRSEERAADRDSIRWSQEPEALISGLARASLSGGMPLHWGAPISWMLSHPSTSERMSLIAAAGGVPESRIPELIRQAQADADDHYEIPAIVPDGAAFSPVLRQQLSGTLTLYALAAPVILGVGIAWALEKAGFDGISVFALGAPGSMAAFYIGYEMIVGKIRESVRLRAVAKNGGGIFVGLSPSPEPRIYDGMYHYDFGLVRFSPGELEFTGDRTRFTLDSRRVEHLRLGDGPRHWTPRKVVYVECRNPDGTSTAFSLQSFEARIWPWTVIAARDLYAKIESWREQPVPAIPPPLPCDVPRISGEPDRSAGLSKVARSVTIYAGVGMTVTSVFGMANLERGFDWQPALLCAALAAFAAWPQIMKSRTA